MEPSGKRKFSSQRRKIIAGGAAITGLLALPVFRLSGTGHSGQVVNKERHAQTAVKNARANVAASPESLWLGNGLSGEFGAVAVNNAWASTVYDYSGSLSGGVPRFAPEITTRQPTGSPVKPRRSGENPHNEAEYLVVNGISRRKFRKVCNDLDYETIYLAKGTNLSGLGIVEVSAIGSGRQITYWDPDAPSAIRDIKPWNLAAEDRVHVHQINYSGAQGLDVIGLTTDGAQLGPDVTVCEINAGARNLRFWRCYHHHHDSFQAISVGDNMGGEAMPSDIVFYQCVIHNHYNSAGNDSNAIDLFSCTACHVVSCEMWNIRSHFVQWNNGEYPVLGCAIEDNDFYETSAWYTDKAGYPDVNGPYSYGESGISTKGVGDHEQENACHIIGNRIFDVHDPYRAQDASQVIGGSVSTEHNYIVVEANVLDSCIRDLQISYTHFESVPKNERHSIRKNLIYGHKTARGRGRAIYVSQENCEIYLNTIVSAGGQFAFELFADNATLDVGDTMGNYIKNYADGQRNTWLVGPDVDFHYNAYSSARGGFPASHFNQGGGADQAYTNAELEMGDFTYRVKKLTTTGETRTIPGVVPTSDTPASFLAGVPGIGHGDRLGTYRGAGVDNSFFAGW